MPTAKLSAAQREGMGREGMDEEDEEVRYGQPARQHEEEEGADEDGADVEAYRRAYLRERDAMLAQAGLGELVGMEPPPPMSPSDAPASTHTFTGWGGRGGGVGGGVDRRAEAAARAAALLGGGASSAAEIEEMDDEEEEQQAAMVGEAGVQMMSQAEASARARQILEQTRREFGRRA